MTRRVNMESISLLDICNELEELKVPKLRKPLPRLETREKEIRKRYISIYDFREWWYPPLSIFMQEQKEKDYSCIEC